METTNRRDEALSALVDGETAGAETRRMIDALLGDEALRERWDRYHLIGEVLRRGEPPLAAPDLAARVMDRIEAQTVVPVRRARRWGRPLASLALAASLAGGLAFGLQAMLGNQGGRQALQGAPTATATLAFASDGADPGHHVPLQLESYMRMHAYALGHVEQSATGGVMAYARLVSDQTVGP